MARRRTPAQRAASARNLVAARKARSAKAGSGTPTRTNTTKASTVKTGIPTKFSQGYIKSYKERRSRLGKASVAPSAVMGITRGINSGRSSASISDEYKSKGYRR